MKSLLKIATGVFSSGSPTGPSRSSSSPERPRRSPVSFADKAQRELYETFLQFDTNGDGIITRDELANALQKLDPAYWSDANVDMLIRAADRDGDGNIQYLEFVEWVTGRAAARQVADDLVAAPAAMDPATALATMDSEFEFQISQAFFRFDRNNDGIITREELAAVLQTLDPRTWHDEKVNVLLQYADTNGDKLIQYREFCAWLLGQPPARKLAQALTGEATIVTCLGPTEAKIYEAFRTFDSDGDGIISREELALVLHRLDPFSWNDRKVDALLRAADTNGDDNIQYEEFVQWVMDGSKDLRTTEELFSSPFSSEAYKGEGDPPGLVRTIRPTPPAKPPLLSPQLPETPPPRFSERKNSSMTISIVKMNGQTLKAVTLGRQESVRNLRAAASEALGGQPCRLVAGSNYLGNRLSLAEAGLVDGVAVTAVVSTGMLEFICTGNGGFAALKADGSVVTWGSAHAGGDSSRVAELLRDGVDHIFASWSAFAALKADGSVVCWGNPKYGGDSSLVVDKLRGGVVDIASTREAFAARKGDGSVVVWGNTFRTSEDPACGVTAVVSNRLSFAALRKDGSVCVWGNAAYGGTLSSEVSQQLAGLAARIFSTQSAFTALKADGSIVAWGDPGMGGSLGEVSGQLSSGVKEVYATQGAFAAVKTTGSVVTWGHRDAGGCCEDVAAQLAENVERIFATESAFAALKCCGSVVCWGLEGGSVSAQSVASQLEDGVVSIASTASAFAALKTDGVVVAWGKPNAGGSCAQVAHLLRCNVERIHATEGAFAALQVGGSVVAWGAEACGGDASAVEDHLREGVSHVFATRQAFAALKVDNSVIAWGAGVDPSALAKLQPFYAPVSAG